MPTKIKKVKIVEKDLSRVRMDGSEVWGMWYPNNVIHIHNGLKGKKKLKIFIHELLHQADASMSESKVRQVSKFLSDYLWKHGFRPVED